MSKRGHMATLNRVAALGTVELFRFTIVTHTEPRLNMDFSLFTTTFWFVESISRQAAALTLASVPLSV